MAAAVRAERSRWVREEHLVKATPPMVVRDAENDRDGGEGEQQPEKASLPMEVRLRDAGGTLGLRRSRGEGGAVKIQHTRTEQRTVEGKVDTKAGVAWNQRRSSVYLN